MFYETSLIAFITHRREFKLSDFLFQHVAFRCPTRDSTTSANILNRLGKKQRRTFLKYLERNVG